MRKILLLFIMLCFCRLYNQNLLNSYEYWFNYDYSNKQVIEITPAIQHNWVEDIDVSYLPDGINVLNVRYIDENNFYSVVLAKNFYKNTGTYLENKKLVSYEYWFNNDITNKHVVEFTPTNQYNWIEDIDVSALPDGLNTINIRFVDEKGFYSTIYTKTFNKNTEIYTENKKLVSYEYWFNNDITNKHVVEFTPTNQYNWIEDIDVSALPDGLNTINIRLKDEKGFYSTIYTQTFSKNIETYTENKKLVSYEYWFNNDITNKHVVEITPTNQYNWIEDIDVSALNEGVNILNVCFKDEKGFYSSTYSKTFYKNTEIPTPDKKLVSYEYWFNNDYANKQVFDITPANQHDLIANLNTSSLSDGVNILNIRYKDEKGFYSSTYSKTFYKNTEIPTPDKNLVSYEYWYNNDYSNKQVFDFTPAHQHDLTTNLNTSSLSDGVNILNIRYRDEKGFYSSIYSKSFYKNTEIPTPDKKLVSYEYWYNNDYSNKQVEIITPTTQHNLITNINALNLSNGFNELNIRYKDEKNFYSSLFTKSFCKTTFTIQAFPDSICIGDTTMIVVSGTDAYEWSNGLGTNDTVIVSPNITTKYYVTGTDNSTGFSNIDSIMIVVNPLPIVIATATPDIICDGQNSLLNVTGADTYSWNYNLGNSNNIGISPGNTTTYYVTGTITSTGCSAVDSVTITVNPTYLIEENHTICQGDTYSWHGQTLNNAGVYYDNLQTINGCDSIYKLTLSVNQSPIVNLGNDTTVCGTGITLNAGSGFTSYQWSTGASTQLITVNSSDTYSVTVTNAQNCSNSDEINVTISNISINLEQMGTDLVATIDPVVLGVYTWYTCDNQLVPNITTSTYQNAPVDECFYVIFTDEVNCEWISNEVIVVTIDENVLPIASIYPNPAIDAVYIELLNDKLANIYVYDIVGKLVLSKKSDNSKIKLDVSQLSGTYILKIVTDKGQSVFRLIVTK